MPHFFNVVKRGCLGQLENEPRRIDAVRGNLGFDQVQQVRVADRFAGQVDCHAGAFRQALHAGQADSDNCAIELADQAEYLAGFYQFACGTGLAVVVKNA